MPPSTKINITGTDGFPICVFAGVDLLSATIVE